VLQPQATLAVAPVVQAPTQVPLQLVWPEGQTQLVPVHTRPPGQVAHAPPQQVWVAPQVETQVPFEQV
jgi:hypothetical protein